MHIACSTATHSLHSHCMQHCNTLIACILHAVLQHTHCMQLVRKRCMCCSACAYCNACNDYMCNYCNDYMRYKGCVAAHAKGQRAMIFLLSIIACADYCTCNDCMQNHCTIIATIAHVMVACCVRYSTVAHAAFNLVRALQRALQY